MRMKSIFLVICVGLLALATQVFAQPKPVLLVTFDYPPFMGTQDNHPQGMMIDVIAEAFKRMGTPFKIEVYPLARDLAMLESGEADALFTVKKTPEREASYVFSKEPVLTQDYVFFVTKDSKIEFKGDLNGLADVSVGIVSKVSFGKVFDTAVQKGTFKKLDTAPTYDSNFQKLLANHVDTVICSRIPGLAILKRLNASGKAKVSGPPVEIAQSYMMFKKGVSPALVEAFDKAIAAMRKDGTYDKLQNAYTK
jgi:polar amino acid transport system substrate-binding protein